MKVFPVAMLSKNADPVWDEAEKRPVNMTHGARKKRFVLMTKDRYDEMLNIIRKGNKQLYNFGESSTEIHGNGDAFKRDKREGKDE